MTTSPENRIGLARCKLLFLGDRKRNELPERTAEREHYQAMLDEALAEQAARAAREPIHPMPTRPVTETRLPYRDDD